MRTLILFGIIRYLCEYEMNSNLMHGMFTTYQGHVPVETPETNWIIAVQEKTDNCELL